MTSDVVYASEKGVVDKQQEIRAAKEAIAGPVPLIEDAPDPVLRLPRGLFHSGIWEREVRCRELTGVDEEALAKTTSPYAYFNTVLSQGVVSIGSFDLSTLSAPERQFYLSDLLIGEREQIFLKIVQVSFGNAREISFTCQVCAELQDVKLLLDTDFKPAQVENVEATILEHTTSKGEVLSYRAALGSDQEEIMDKKGLSVAEQNTMMLARCISKRNGEIIPDPTGFARSLPIRDRKKLLDLLVERQPQIDLNITTTCAACGASQMLGMGWGTSFVPNEQALYVNYDVIASNYSGWTLSEIRAMTGRQRNYWLRMIAWKRVSVPVADDQDAARISNLGAGLKVNLKEVEGVSGAVSGLSAAIKTLESTLQDFGNKSYTLADKINRHIKSIGDTAVTVTGQLSGLTAAVGGASSGGAKGTSTVPSPQGTTSSGGKAGWAYDAASSASAAIKRVTSIGEGSKLTGGLSLGTFIGSGDDFATDVALAPLRFLRNRINTNRDTAMMVSGGLNMQALQQGVSTSDLMHGMSKFPGSIYGTPQDLMGLFGAAPQLGASYGFGGTYGEANTRGQGVRAAGFFKGIREMQMMNPMASVGGEGGLVSQLGGYAGDTGAQQRAMMFTGGAMGMIAAGGRQKSLSEWAESILRWFEGLRPGGKRGKGFDYGELMAQYFPGSNIDAWFNANQVPQNMRDYWWTYALGKVSRTPTGLTTDAQTIGGLPVIQAPKDNVAWERLRSSSELTRTEFGLAGSMAGQYAQRESSNRWFNELIGQMQQDVIPALAKNPIGALISHLPDALEDLLMTFAERGMNELFDGGDIGDIGDSGGYGQFGGTGLGGLHPDMQSKVGRMMKANPRLRVSSGLRDTGLQKRLKEKGYSNVSGKPSAHTRGMAADLGPRSEYGWIARNARKFGLASGKGHGEPWHVGMQGDIPGIGDVFDDLKEKMSGYIGAEGMADFVTKILGRITGKLGSLFGGDAEPFAQGADDLYARLVAKSQNVVLGMSPGGGGGGGGGVRGDGVAAITTTRNGASVAGTASGWAPDGVTWLGTSPSGRGDRYNMTASADIIADIQANDATTRGSAVAKALHNAGFRGEELRNMLKIAYRESSWTTNQWVVNSTDVGGGILGVNQQDWTRKKNPKQPAPYTQADVLDPQASAYIAMDMFNSTPPVHGNRGYSAWNQNGDPFGGLPIGTESLASQALQKAGLGDIEMMQAGMNLIPGRGGGGNVVFQNEFKLDVGGYGGASNGGIDVRRTVTLIADHLEDEMKRRLVRSA